MAARHAETLGAEDGNVPTGAIPEPSQADARRLFESLMPRLKSKLTTPTLVFDFLLWFVGSSGLAHEWKENGLLIVRPSADEPSSTLAEAQPDAGQAAAAADAAAVVM